MRTIVLDDTEALLVSTWMERQLGNQSTSYDTVETCVRDIIAAFIAKMRTPEVLP